MPRADFTEQLKSLGYAPECPGGDRVIIAYKVPVGRFAGQQVRLGFTVADDFPLNPPGCLHVSPRLLPLKSGGNHPDGGVHDDSLFGPDWQYWSRPIQHWPTTKRDARAVMAHVHRLFDTQ